MYPFCHTEQRGSVTIRLHEHLITYSVRSETRVDGIQEQTIRASLVVRLQHILREEVSENILPSKFLLVTCLSPLPTVCPSNSGLRVDEGSTSIVLRGVVFKPGLAEVGPLRRQAAPVSSRRSMLALQTHLVVSNQSRVSLVEECRDSLLDLFHCSAGIPDIGKGPGVDGSIQIRLQRLDEVVVDRLRSRVCVRCEREVVVGNKDSLWPQMITVRGGRSFCADNVAYLGLLLIRLKPIPIPSFSELSKLLGVSSQESSRVQRCAHWHDTFE